MYSPLAAALLLAAGLTPVYPDCSPDDLRLFPAPGLVDLCVEFQVEHRAWLETRIGLCAEDREYWRIRREDMAWRWFIWDDVRIAQHTEGDYQLQTLKRLRKWLGDEAYFSGDLPEFVPIWLFEIRN